MRNVSNTYTAFRAKTDVGSQRGFVLVSVLLLGVVFISCATAFAWFTRLQIKGVVRERVILENRSMAQVLTKAIISGLKKNNLVKYDSPRSEWFRPFFFPAADQGMWVIQVTPLDDKIPIRNLFLPDGSTLRNELKKPWENMWEKLEKRDMVYIVLDFMDKDKKPRMGGAERENYINRTPFDLSELLILEEMTPELLFGKDDHLGLADYCTLWSSGKLNLNVAPAHVIATLSGVDDELANKIVAAREEAPLKNTADLREIPGFPPKVINTLMNLSSFNSQYFQIRIELLEDEGGGKNFDIIFNKKDGQIVRWEEI